MHKSPGPLRAAGACLALWLVATPAQARDPERFVQDYVQHGLAILNNKALSHAEKHAQFMALLEPITDMRRVALYALGPAAQNTTDQLEAFIKAFHDLEMSLYERELWRLQALKVEASIERTPGDDIVQAFQLSDDGSRSINADEIDFRVEEANGRDLLVDVCVRGAWIAINQHVQYQDFLAQTGNDVLRLTTKLCNRTSQMNRYLAAGEINPAPPPRKSR